jgi:hypothetical protein
MIPITLEMLGGKDRLLQRKLVNQGSVPPSRTSPETVHIDSKDEEPMNDSHIVLTDQEKEHIEEHVATMEIK